MKTLFAILIVCTLHGCSVYGKIMSGGFWPAPRSSGTPPALSWWQDTNQINIGFWSWNTNGGMWTQDAGAFFGTGLTAVARSQVELGGGAKALRINGSSIDISGTETALNGSTAATIGVWFNVAANVAYAGMIVARSSANQVNAIGQFAGSDIYGAYYTNYATGIAGTTRTFTVTGVWYSAVATFHNNRLDVYTNGVLATTRTPFNVVTLYQDDIFRIGFDDNNAARKFNGWLDWVFVLTNRALNASEISDWHGATYPPTTVP